MVTVFKKVFLTICVPTLAAFLPSSIHAATIAVSTNNLVFPDVCPEYSVTEEVILENTSNVGVTLNIWIQDNTWSQFEIISPSPVPDSLAGYEEVTLTIEFTPPFDTMFTGLLNIRANDDGSDTAWVSLAGAGYCPNCDEPEQLCPGWGLCVNTLIDPNYCGDCNTACPEGDVCIDGGCQPNCGGLTACDGTYVDTWSDPNNCGSCGNVCSEFATCTDGSCQLNCGDLTACNDACVDISNDPFNCGDCGYICPGADIGLASCAAGMCESSECGIGHIDLSHCDDAGSDCVRDVADYFVSESIGGQLYPPEGPSPAAARRFANYLDRLRDINSDLMDCDLASACGKLNLAVLEIDGFNPGHQGGGGANAGSRRAPSVPDAVDGPSSASLKAYLDLLTSAVCTPRPEPPWDPHRP